MLYSPSKQHLRFWHLIHFCARAAIRVSERSVFELAWFGALRHEFSGARELYATGMILCWCMYTNNDSWVHNGWISIWLQAGIGKPTSRSCSMWWIFQLDTPIERTSPSCCSCTRPRYCSILSFFEGWAWCRRYKSMYSVPKAARLRRHAFITSSLLFAGTPKIPPGLTLVVRKRSFLYKYEMIYSPHICDTSQVHWRQ